MYLLMENLAGYILNSQSDDFETIWNEWSSKNEIKEEMQPYLKKMGRLLCGIDKKAIDDVPSLKYQICIKRILKKNNNIKNQED